MIECLTIEGEQSAGGGRNNSSSSRSVIEKSKLTKCLTRGVILEMSRRISFFLSLSTCLTSTFVQESLPSSTTNKLSPSSPSLMMVSLAWKLTTCMASTRISFSFSSSIENMKASPSRFLIFYFCSALFG